MFIVVLASIYLLFKLLQKLTNILSVFLVFVGSLSIILCLLSVLGVITTSEVIEGAIAGLTAVAIGVLLAVKK